MNVMAHPKQVVGHTLQDYPRVLLKYGGQTILTDSPDYYTVIENGKFSFFKYD